MGTLDRQMRSEHVSPRTAYASATSSLATNVLGILLHFSAYVNTSIE